MQAPTITKQQARRFMLAHQGLWPPHQLKSKLDIVEYIRRVGCIQFDPLDIVGHNPELVLQARVGNFKPIMLYELLYEDRRLLDGFDKNMSIYCIDDWPYFNRRRQWAAHHPRYGSHPVKSIAPRVFREIAEKGPLSSADLNYNQTVDWPWAPTRLSRAALESMYFGGDLVIHHKVKTRKVYDLARRHIPEPLLAASDPNDTEERYHDWYVHRRIGGVGLLWNRSGDAWLDMRGIKGPERGAALPRLLAQGRLLEVQVEGIRQTFYLRSEDRPLFEKSLNWDEIPRAAILAPLDNLLWDRNLVRDLFEFDYKWEVYKPAAERRYGYYVLPILYGDRFVARFEPGRDGTKKRLLIKNWWWEPSVAETDQLHEELRICFSRFMSYLGVTDLQIGNDKLSWLTA